MPLAHLNGLSIPKAATAGAPTSGAHVAGELYMDSRGMLYTCTVAGTPGIWFTPTPTVTTNQYVSVAGSDSNDGLTWGTAKATISAAVAALPTQTFVGVTFNAGNVFVGPGTFVESGANPIPICGDLSIWGAGANAVFAEAGGGVASGTIIKAGNGLNHDLFRYPPGWETIASSFSHGLQWHDVAFDGNLANQGATALTNAVNNSTTTLPVATPLTGRAFPAPVTSVVLTTTNTSATATFTGTLFTRWDIGLTITGTGIQAATTITNVDEVNHTITLSLAANGSGTNTMTVGRYFLVWCDTEIMKVTAGWGTNSWTVVRGALGSLAVAHLTAAPVVILMNGITSYRPGYDWLIQNIFIQNWAGAFEHCVSAAVDNVVMNVAHGASAGGLCHYLWELRSGDDPGAFHITNIQADAGPFAAVYVIDNANGAGNNLAIVDGKFEGITSFSSFAPGGATRVAYGATPVNGSSLAMTTGSFTFNVSADPRASTGAGFPTAGAFQVPTAGGLVTVTYTGITASSFTGCTVASNVSATASQTATAYGGVLGATAAWTPYQYGVYYDKIAGNQTIGAHLQNFAFKQDLVGNISTAGFFETNNFTGSPNPVTCNLENVSIIQSSGTQAPAFKSARTGVTILGGVSTWKVNFARPGDNLQSSMQFGTQAAFRVSNGSNAFDTGQWMGDGSWKFGPGSSAPGIIDTRYNFVTPEAGLTSDVGGLAVLQGGAPGRVLYVKESGAASNTGWEPIGGWIMCASTVTGSALVTTGAITLYRATYTELMIIWRVQSLSATDKPMLRFNADTGANYRSRFITAAAGGVTLLDAPFVSQTGLILSAPASGTVQLAGKLIISNLTATAKLAQMDAAIGSGAAATSPAICLGGTGEWVNTAAQISSVEMRTLGGSVTMGTGSGFVVYGRTL